MHFIPKRDPRILLITLTAILAATFVAACGSSSSSSSSSTSNSTGGASTQFAKFDACLKSNGVSVSTQQAARPGGASGTSTTGGPASGTGKPPAGKKGSFTPPKGAKGKRPASGAGFLGGTGSKKEQAAYKACAKYMPKGAKDAAPGGFAGGSSGGASGSAQYSSATIEKFAACVKQHGYMLPKANTSGTGSIYPKTIEANKKFQAASKGCQSLLKPPGAAASGVAG